MNALACQLNTLLVIVIKCYFIAYYIFLSREQKYLCLFCSLHFTQNNNKMFGFQVWDLATLQCIQTLSDHTDVVMSVLCWDQFLLSCSLDQTIKVSSHFRSFILLSNFVNPSIHVSDVALLNTGHGSIFILCRFGQLQRVET